MPRITQGNAKEHLFSAVKKFIEVTGKQVGIVVTWKGNLTVIGKESFKEFVNDHRGDVQRSLVLQLVHPTSPNSIAEENSNLLEFMSDPSTLPMEKLRKLVTQAIRKSIKVPFFIKLLFLKSIFINPYC